jgi:hypothetical protein
MRILGGSRWRLSTTHGLVNQVVETRAMVMKFGGWLRIGVVLSVLWIVGYPIYSFIDERAYQTCLKIHTEYFPNPDLSSADIRARCQKTAFELTGPILANENFWILFVAVALALLILGVVIFWTIRWIRRGFVGSGKP